MSCVVIVSYSARTSIENQLERDNVFALSTPNRRMLNRLARSLATSHAIQSPPIPFGGRAGGGGGGAVGLPGAARAGGGGGCWIDLTAVVQPLPAAANAPQRASAASGPSSCECWVCWGRAPFSDLLTACPSSHNVTIPASTNPPQLLLATGGTTPKLWVGQIPPSTSSPLPSHLPSLPLTLKYRYRLWRAL